MFKKGQLVSIKSGCPYKYGRIVNQIAVSPYYRVQILDEKTKEDNGLIYVLSFDEIEKENE